MLIEIPLNRILKAIAIPMIVKNDIGHLLKIVEAALGDHNKGPDFSNLGFRLTPQAGHFVLWVSSVI
jgi:hypothetical protein